MKRIFILGVAFFALSSTSVWAQNVRGITGKGIKIGGNLADLGGEDAKDPEPDPKLGFMVGGFLTLGLAESFSIQPELHFFSMKGAKISFDTTYIIEGLVYSEKWDIEYRLNYLDIPVLAKFTLPTKGSVKPFLFLGPSLGFLLSADGKGTIAFEALDDYGNPIDTTITIKDDFYDETKVTDFGFVFGGGVGFEVGASIVTVDIRYGLGLSTIDKVTEEEKQSGVTKDEDIKNRVFSLMVGYSF